MEKKQLPIKLTLNKILVLEYIHSLPLALPSSYNLASKL